MKKDKFSPLNNLKPPIFEAYKTLRTNIQFASLDKKLKSISVTSSGPGEGKTTIITNLSITMAQMNQKVLLIDGNLRRPNIHTRFELSNDIGLTNILTENECFNNAVQKSPIEGLDIITAGPKPLNPSEILGSNTMRDFIEEISSKYDRILIDSAPVGVVTDGAVLSAIVGGTILVVLSGKTYIEEAQKAKQLLKNVNANILGVLLNKMPIRSTRYYNY